MKQLSKQDVINTIQKNPNYDSFFETDESERKRSIICDVANIQVRFFMSLGTIDYNYLQNPAPGTVDMNEVLEFCSIAKQFLSEEALRRGNATFSQL